MPKLSQSIVVLSMMDNSTIILRLYYELNPFQLQLTNQLYGQLTAINVSFSFFNVNYRVIRR